MPSYQPFQCLICLVRFTRHENLKRHAALHSRSQGDASLSCEVCQASFSRPDLRHRHMKRKHLEHEQRRATRPHRDPPALRQGSEGWSPQPGSSHTGSSQPGSPQPGYPQTGRSQAESQDGLLRRNFGNEGELEMANSSWHTELRYAEHQFDYDHYAESTNLATNAATGSGDRGQLGIDPLTNQQSRSGSTCSCQIERDTANLERNLLLETPFLKAAHHVDTQLHPQTISPSAPFDTNLASFNVNKDIYESVLLNNLPQLQENWSPSAQQITRGCNLFFTHVSHFVPFLHQPTFDVTLAAPHLVLSILCVAYQYGEDPECGDQVGSGRILSTRCFRRARALINSNEEKADHLTHTVMMAQTYLLLQICAMMYLCGDDSTCVPKMHSSMISLARAGGMMHPLSIEPAATQDLESLWREFIKAESHKRTLFAVHQIDTLWYQFLSIPRSISHLEIKHDLPCAEDHWAASSSAEWAHRQLAARHSGPSVQYEDAVRRFLSPNADLNSIPAFDPYGAINITQFLLSSTREISGWSTMTGIISMERLGALKSSLDALKPFIHPRADTTKATNEVTCAATWETAMIELQMWSPAHTGGIVEASVDALLNRSTDLALSYEFLCTNTAKAVQPHVDWFLRYLDTTLAPDSEAPWITLYAYKAFLIAWQLVNMRLPGAMQVVGIEDGDMERALIWARKVFQRRSRWQLSKLIISCLDNLGERRMH